MIFSFTSVTGSCVSRFSSVNSETSTFVPYLFVSYFSVNFTSLNLVPRIESPILRNCVGSFRSCVLSAKVASTQEEKTRRNGSWANDFIFNFAMNGGCDALSVGFVLFCHSSRLLNPSPSGSWVRTSASAIGRLNCSNHSLGTGGWTSVVCSVAGRPFAPIKCFSGTNRPDRLLNVHCAGCFSFSIACSISTAFGGGAAGLGGGARSEEHTSELQSPCNLVCRLLLEKKKYKRLCLRL